MKLSESEKNRKVKIVSMPLKKNVIRQLNDLGMKIGTEIAFCYTAPSGDPLVFELRGYLLALSRSVAEKIEVLA